MQSPSMQEPLHSHTPESNFNPVVKVSQLDLTFNSSSEICCFLRHEEDELAGYVFDSDLLREGSD